MKLKKYIFGMMLAFGASGAFNAQAQPTYTIDCNYCSDSQKELKVQQMVDSGFSEGDYRFYVIDMGNGNMREFSVDVPYQNFGEFGTWSQPSSVQLKYRADQGLLDGRVKELAETISSTYDNISGSVITVPDSSGYLSAYRALTELSQFSAYLTTIVNQDDSVAAAIRDGKLKLELLSENLQVGLSAIASVALSINPNVTTTIKFADGSTLKIKLKLERSLTDGLQVDITVTMQGTDKDGNPLPLTSTQLGSYSNGAGGLNQSSLEAYFRSIGVTINYSADISGGGGGGSCETRWRCGSDGKVCTLEIIAGSC